MTEDNSSGPTETIQEESSKGFIKRSLHDATLFWFLLGSGFIYATLGSHFEMPYALPIGISVFGTGGIGIYMMYMNSHVAANLYRKFDESQEKIIEKIIEKFDESQEKIIEKIIEKFDESQKANLKEVSAVLEKIDGRVTTLESERKDSVSTE